MMKKMTLTNKIRKLLMKVDIVENNNGIRRFEFTTKDFIKGKEFEIIGIRDKGAPYYNIIFYNKTNKQFYGYIIEDKDNIEKNMILKKVKRG